MKLTAKKLVLTSAAILTMTIISACGGKEPEPTTAATTAETTTDAVSGATEKTGESPAEKSETAAK
ncbi:MAG: hypothetical protein QM657_19045 [Lacrimispora sp.]|uniref:hypothetical protein n=1 Tax=Lacrimispora sp. TaxID=2719234 RepID=UPI0039E4FA90